MSAVRVMLLCLSSGGEGFLHDAVEVAGDVAFEAADGFAGALAVAGALLDVGAGRRVVVATAQHDGVQGAVELAVTATVEAVAHDLPGGCRQRCDAGEAGK